MSDADARQQALDLTGPVIAMRFPRDSSLARQIVDTAGDYVLAAEMDLLEGRTSAARKRLSAGLRARITDGYDELALDGIVNEARLWMFLGDTITARSLVEKGLSDLRYAQPLTTDQFGVNQLRMGAIAMAVQLNSVLQPPERRRKWSRALHDLRSRADESVRKAAVSVSK